MTDSKTFCPMPWYHVSSNPDGCMRPCCVSPNTNFKFGKHKIRDFWNSELMKDIRVKMLNGEWPDSCMQCKSDEERNVRSHREIFVETSLGDMRTHELIWKRKKNTKDDGFLEDDPVYFDMKFGNLCNLRCRMCTPTSSSQLFKEIKNNITKVFPAGTLREFEKTKGYTNWYDDDEFGREFNDLSQNMTKFKATGGEPFLIDKVHEFLDHCIKNKYTKNIELQFITNGTKITDDLLKKLKKFKKCMLLVSIDGHGEVYNYIRNPARFNNIRDNLIKISKSGVRVEVLITAQILNVFNVYHLTSMLKELDIIFSFIYLHNPAYYDISILPDVIKEKLNDKIDAYLVGNIDSNMSQQYTNLKNHLNSVHTDSEKHLKEFKRVTRLYDKIRDESLLDLYEFMGDDDEWNLCTLAYPDSE